MAKRGRPPYPDVLTPRQWEVLALLRRGLSNEEIARRLGISLDGVKFHVREILGKLEVRNRADAATWQPAGEVPERPQASRAGARLRRRAGRRHRRPRRCRAIMVRAA